jgi:NADPH:quinone reductase-like Zn-dependent oxidoreductase
MASKFLPTRAVHAIVSKNQDDVDATGTMKCALISSHGDDIDELLSMSNNYPKPKLERKKRELLIKVHACALAPGDIRVMKGHCDLFQSPPEGFPYVPGGDVSGIVQEADPHSRFKKGDRVFAMFELPRPVHGLAEYAIVKEANAEIIPDGIDFLEAAALTSSAVAASIAANEHVRPGSRVLILGGNGGVGTFLIQYAKKIQNASFVAVTSSTKEPERLVALGVDRVVDYTQQIWYTDIPEFEDDPFDVIFDLGVGRKQAWTAAKSYSSLLKRQTGKYVTFSGHNPELKVHDVWQACGLMAVMYSRMIGSACNPLIPKYVWHNGLDIKDGVTLKEILCHVREGKLELVLDPISPLPFTLDGIRRGFHLMNSRHANGKVVVQIISP